MNKLLSSYYRLPADFEASVCLDEPTGHSGYFRFGPEGQCGKSIFTAPLFDASKDVGRVGSEIRLPFDICQVIEYLRQERYAQTTIMSGKRVVQHELIRKAYYCVRKLLPVSLRRHLQRSYFKDWQALPFPNWPVDFTVDGLHELLLRLAMEATGVRKVPFIWFWPEGAPNCLIMTHDVETEAGRDFTSKLMDLDSAYGLNASFQVIPEERYTVPDDYIRAIRDRGFEFNVHDLNHDGHLFKDREEFLLRAKKINEYVHKYEARGFRAGAMYRNQDWYDAFDVSYDMSVPTVAHLEPQRGGCCTVMPYFIGDIVELPLTASQDYSVFHILNNYSIDLWKRQLDILRSKNGLMSFIAHPDYLIERRTRKVFESLLDYLQHLVARENVWAALPRDVDLWWRARSQMRLVARGDTWEIEGPEKERACVAFAIVDGSSLAYEVDTKARPKVQNDN